jgi:hypothetical protein
MTLVVLSFRIFGTDKGYRKLKALKSADHNYEYVEEKVAKINRNGSPLLVSRVSFVTL